MAQALVKEIIDLMEMYHFFITMEDMENEAKHVLSLISTLTLSLKYSVNQPLGPST